MYKKYKDLSTARTFLELDASGRPSSRRLKICVVALLWRMAKADQKTTKIEFNRIIRLIDSEFHLMDAQAAELVQVAAYLDEKNQHLDEFIGEVNRAFDQEQREHLFDMLIEVAKADENFNEHEKELARVIREKLNLPL